MPFSFWSCCSTEEEEYEPRTRNTNSLSSSSVELEQETDAQDDNNLPSAPLLGKSLQLNNMPNNMPGQLSQALLQQQFKSQLDYSRRLNALATIYEDQLLEANYTEEEEEDEVLEENNPRSPPTAIVSGVGRSLRGNSHPPDSDCLDGPHPGLRKIQSISSDLNALAAWSPSSPSTLSGSLDHSLTSWSGLLSVSLGSADSGTSPSWHVGL
jgi:hypothetical protein